MLISLAEDFIDNDDDAAFSRLYHFYFQDSYEVPIYSDRPCLYKSWEWDSCYRYLNDEIHEWFTSYNVDYELHCIIFKKNKEEYIIWAIEITEEIALLFKLTWGGKIADFSS